MPLNIAEHRQPQDGQFTFVADNLQDIQVRVATLPTRHGQRLSLRFAAHQVHDPTFEELGMNGWLAA